MLSDLIHLCMDYVQALFGNIFLTCALISLLLLAAELLFYRIRTRRGKESCE